MRKFKKLLSVMLAVMMVMSVMSANVLVASAEPAIPEGATLIFAEDFESGYNTDTDFLANGTVEIEKNGKKVLKLTNSANLADDVAYVKVTDGTSNGFSGNVLEVKNADNTKANGILMYINFDAVDTQSTDSPYYGKQIVMEYDAKVTGYAEDKFMGISTGTTNGFQRVSNTNIIVSSGAYVGNSNDATKRNWFVRPMKGPVVDESSMAANLNLSNKNHIKTVFEQSGAVDTIRTYAKDNILIKSSYPYVLDGDSNYGKTVKDYVGEGYTGAATLNYGKLSYFYSKIYARNTSAPASVFIDNIVVYAVDPIEFDKLENNTNVTSEGGFEVSFTQPFNATKDTFAVSLASDATNAKIENAITEVIMSSDKMSATIKVDFDKLDSATSYMLWVDDEFTSAAGAIYYKDHTGISAADEWQPLDTFTTCKKLTLESMTPATVENYVQGENQEITLTFNDALALNEANLAAAFEVKDANEEVVTGLTAAYGATNNVVVLQLSGLTLGRGNHTIKSKANALYNAANTYADVEYTFGTLDFNAAAEETTFDYVPTTDKTVVVNLTVPTTLTNETIATGFVVKDSQANEVTGLTATLDGTGKIVTLQLSGLLGLATGTYTIDVTDALVDGANRTAMLDEEITFTVPAFEVTSVSANNFTMKPGEAKNVQITLSIPTALTEAELYDAFVIEDAEGGVVTGLDITLDNTGKVITLYLQGIEASNGKYTIKSNETLVDQAGRTLVEAINVPFEIAEYVNLFVDDFEGYATGEDILAVEDDAYTFTVPTSGNSSAKIIDGSSKGFDGNVLELRTTSTTDFNFVIELNGGNAIDTQSPDSPYYGKQLIYEFDVQASGLKETPFMNIDSKVASSVSGNINPFQKATGNNWALRNGVWQTEWNISNLLSMASKTRMKVVFDQTGDVDLVRTYANGVLGTVDRVSSTADIGSRFNGKVVKDFVGEYWRGETVVKMSAPKTVVSNLKVSTGEAIIYIDNFKAYLVDAIEFADENNKVAFGTNDSNAFNPAKGLEIAFTQRVDAEMLKKALAVTKTDDLSNTPNYNAIRNVELSADGKVAKVLFDANALDGLTSHTLWIDDEFTSAYGALMFTNPFGVAPEEELIPLATFTTVEKLEVTIDKSVISGYDQGDDETVTITLSSALKDGVNPADIFVVKDEAGNEIEGLAATISEDRKVITLQLSGLQLRDGVHTIESIQDALVNNSGVAGSVLITVDTVDFVAVPTPASGTILNYVQGTDEKVLVILTTAAVLEAGDISDYFVVIDANGTEVAGLKATLAADKKNIELDISGVQLGVGEHTIKIKDGVTDSRGRDLEFEYKFGIMPFISNYTAEITGYVPGSEQVVEVKLTYPLNAASIANAANAFVVKNQYGSSVSGLGVTVSEDAKTITLDLSTLDITGGTYVIASKTDVFVNVKGEILAGVVIDLSTSEDVSEETVKEDAGVGPNAGTDMTGDFVTNVLLSEDFDNEGYARNMNWLSSDAFVPAKFVFDKIGKATDFVDASVSIVEDPVNPGNYVLKNVAGYKDATGTVIAGKDNYHKVKRELDTGVTSIPVDDYTVVKLTTKVYIPSDGVAGIPTGDSGKVGDTKDLSTIIALTNSGTTSLNHSNLRRSSAAAQYNSYVNASESASGSSGTASASLECDTWHTIDLVFGYNAKSDGSKFKSYEVYVNGEKITALGGAYAKNSDYATIGGMMSMLASSTGGGGVTTVYYDDWSVVKMNRLLTHINVPKEEVPEDQQIKLQLTGKLTDESVALIEEKDLITIKDDEGNDVDATITIDNTGVNTKIEIIPTYCLEYQKQFTVEIAENYVDDKGMVTTITDESGSIFGGFTYSFESAKALGNTIDMDNGTLVYDADYMHNEDTFNYTMQLKEAVGTTPVIGAVATFSEDNKLLGIEYQVFNTGEISKDFTVSSELGAKSIKLFIWEQNSDGTMGRLMQIPDEVTSR